MKKYKHLIIRIAILLILVLCTFLFVKSDIEILHIEFVLSSIISATTTLTGFLFTGITLLVGFSSKVLNAISNSKRASRQLKILCIESVTLGLIIIVLCICFGAYLDETNIIHLIWARIFILVCGMFLTSFAEISYYLISIFTVRKFPIEATDQAGVPKNFKA